MNAAAQTIGRCLRTAANNLQEISPTPGLDAEIILSTLLSINRVELLANSDQELSLSELEKFEALIARRKGGEPVAYLTGHKEFFGYEFTVTPAVLVPRPETEILVAEALNVAAEFEQPVRILDLGTGSGCIAIALALELKKLGLQFEIVATDRSDAALNVARDNARRLGAKVNFMKSNWFERVDKQFHLIVSNPPYVADGDLRVSREVAFEPKEAVYAGPVGDEAIRQILTSAPAHLLPGGYLFLEIGAGQAAEVRAATTHRPDFIKDLAGHPRVAKFKPYSGPH